MSFFRQIEEVEVAWKPVIGAHQIDRSSFVPRFLTNAPQSFPDRHVSLSGHIPSLGLHIMENVYIGEGGIIFDQERKILFREDVITPYWRQCLERRLDGPDDGTLLYRFVKGESAKITEFAGPVVSLANPGCEVYGHWLLDIWPMGYLLYLSDLSARCSPTFVVPHRAPSYAIKIFQQKISPSCSFVRYHDTAEILFVKKLIVPSMLRVSPVISDQMIDYAERFAGMKKGFGRMIYISRSRYSDRKGRVLVNEKEVCQTLSNHGFEVFRPELHTIDAQLEAFRNASFVVGESGSGLHNTLFSPEGARVLVLANSYTNLNQSAIGALRGHTLGYLFGEEKLNEEGGIEIMLRPDQVLDCVKSLAIA